LPINFAIGLSISLILEGPLALMSKILMLHFAKWRAKKKIDQKSRDGDEFQCIQKVKKSETSTQVSFTEPHDLSLSKRSVRFLPKLVPSKSLEDHNMTRVD
jgi:hypothetical protein